MQPLQQASLFEGPSQLRPSRQVKSLEVLQGEDFAGSVIHFAFAKTRLGLGLLAWQSDKVCYLGFGEDPEKMYRHFDQYYPIGRHEQSTCPPEISQVWDMLNNPASPKSVAISLRVTGTAFQASVWQALLEIQQGATISYSQLALRLGHKTRSNRAVAGAVAANRVAWLIPCHRVVKADGHPAGYAWGLNRKLALLREELAIRADQAKKDE